MRSLLTCLALTLATHALALPVPPLAPELASLQPAPVLPDTTSAMDFRDSLGDSGHAVFNALPVDGPGLACRVEIPVRGKNASDVEVTIKTATAVKKGDVVLAHFMARAPVARQESGEGSLGFAFQLGVAPHDKSYFTTLAPGPEWTLYEVPFTATRDFDAGQAVVALAFAGLAQTLEISGLQVLNFGTRAKLDQLPKLHFTYKGRETDAPWRAAALKRIEEIRTAPLVIQVTDGAGKPLTGARVEARLIQSKFIWGTSVDDKLIVADTPDADRYRATILEFFNTVVIENGLKWATWSAGSERQAIALKALEWIDSHKLRHKGHNLVWPAWKFSPRGQRDLPDLANALPKLVDARIREMMRVTQGRSFAWDVVNEPVHERDYFKHIPEAAMADWFKLAHSLDPEAQLFINEYGMLNSTLSPDMIARFVTLIQSLRKAGAPIGGIGIQGHVGQQPRSPELVLSDLDLIAAEKLPVQITEFDVNTTDEALQADYTRDFLIACYSHPTMTGFIQWGFWQQKHWKPDAAMFRKDWSEKPNAAVWRDLVLNQWNTRLDTTTSAEGSASVRGHLGRYQVTVTHLGVVKKAEITLTRSGENLTIKFP